MSSCPRGGRRSPRSRRGCRCTAAAHAAAGAAGGATGPRRVGRAGVRAQRALCILAANRLGEALYAPVFASSSRVADRPPNHARFAFLDPRAEEFYGDRERATHDVVAILHAEAGRNPHDRDLTELVGELSTRSETFRALWATHNVRYHDTKHFHHPVVGELTLTYEVMELRADPDLTLFVYSAEPDTADHDG